MKIAWSKSPAFRYSFANGAKYRRGFSSNFLRSSSIRAELAIERGSTRTGDGRGRSPGRRMRIIHKPDGESQSEVTPSLDFSPRRRLTSRARPDGLSFPPALPEFGPVLQQMRGLA